MIPYFQYNTILIGPIIIQVWGLMVALGIMAAVLVMVRLAKKYFLSPEIVLDVSMWALIGGFIGARAFHVVFYNLDYYLLHPWDTLKFWQGGASSLGGFFGAVVAIWIFARLRRMTVKDFLPYSDVLTTGLWLGWGIGRLGCFLIHDHPGTLSHSLLAVKFPAGARLDIGLIESLVGFVLFIFSILMFKRLAKKQWGLLTGISWFLYAAIRFCLDFLRATDLPQSDVRYASLTPAQWGMLVVCAALTATFMYGRVKHKTTSGRVA